MNTSDKSVKNKREPLYDVIKALGMISVVIGHCCSNAQMIVFVYSYHLALFVFVSGLQWKHVQYEGKPFALVRNRLRTMWRPCFFYMSFFTLTHNLCIAAGLLYGAQTFTLKDMAVRMLYNVLLMGEEPLGGALWFVPVLLILQVIFAFVQWFAMKISEKYKLLLTMILSVGIGMLGVFCHVKKFEIILQIHTSLLLLPVFAVGVLLSYFKLDIRKLFRWFWAIPCLMALRYLVFVKGNMIELSVEEIGSVGCFYPITFLGVYCMGALAVLINRKKSISKQFEKIGRYSFDIMALHILVFKIIDVFIGKLLQAGAGEVGAYPCSYQKIWPVYLACCVIFIPLFREKLTVLMGKMKR